MIEYIPRLSQNDPRWSNLNLGNTLATVGQWGCTFTAGVMAASAFGKNHNFEEVLEKANKLGVFDKTGSLSWIPFCEALGVDFGHRWDTDVLKSGSHMKVRELAALQHIERLASWGIPPLLWIDTDHDGKPNHWVVYCGNDRVIDPWDGQVKSLSQTYKSLYGYAILNGFPVYSPNPYVSTMVGKANHIYRGRNVGLNAKEIMQPVNNP